MNLFTGRQARPQASINSLKWLWVVCHLFVSSLFPSSSWAASELPTLGQAALIKTDLNNTDLNNNSSTDGVELKELEKLAKSVLIYGGIEVLGNVTSRFELNASAHQDDPVNLQVKFTLPVDHQHVNKPAKVFTVGFYSPWEQGATCSNLAVNGEFYWLGKTITNHSEQTKIDWFDKWRQGERETLSFGQWDGKLNSLTSFTTTDALQKENVFNLMTNSKFPPSLNGKLCLTFGYRVEMGTEAHWVFNQTPVTVSFVRGVRSAMKDLPLAFSSTPTLNQPVQMSLSDADTVKYENTQWRLLQQPATSTATLQSSGVTASVTPTVAGEYVVEVTTTVDGQAAVSTQNFIVSQDFAYSADKIDNPSGKPLDETVVRVKNQLWVASSSLDEQGLRDLITQQFAGVFQVKGYDSTLELLLVEFDDTNPNAEAQVETLRLAEGVTEVFYRTIEGKNFMKPAKLPPNATDANTFFTNDNWHLKKINASEAWDITTGSQDFLIEIVDDGFLGSHQDLQGRFARIIGNDNFGKPEQISTKELFKLSDEDAAKLPEDKKMITTDIIGDHGTMVTGVIAANANKLGTTGINWQTRVVAVVPSLFSSVEQALGTTQNGKMVLLLNRSTGDHLPKDFDPDDIQKSTSIYEERVVSRLSRKYFYSQFKDTLFIESAGNGVGNGDSTNGIYGVNSKYGNGNAHYSNFKDDIPATIPNRKDTDIFKPIANLLVVGALAREGSLEYYSNFGESVEIAAPTNFSSTAVGKSEKIQVCNPLNTKSCFEREGVLKPLSNSAETGNFTGTSAATPVVTGVASLVYSVNPTLPAATVKQILINSASEDKVCDRYTDNTRTKTAPLPNNQCIPIVNAANAVKMAQKLLLEAQASVADPFKAEAVVTFKPQFSSYQLANLKVIGLVEAYTADDKSGNIPPARIEGNQAIVSLDPSFPIYKLKVSATLTDAQGKSIETTNEYVFVVDHVTLQAKEAGTGQPVGNALIVLESRNGKYSGMTNEQGQASVWIMDNPLVDYATLTTKIGVGTTTLLATALEQLAKNSLGFSYKFIGKKADYKTVAKLLSMSTGYENLVELTMEKEKTQPVPTSVEITVADENGAALEGVSVQFKQGDVTIASPVTTTAAGKTPSVALSQGNYTVSLSKDGYQPSSNPLEVKGSTQSQSYTLVKVVTKPVPTSVEITVADENGAALEGVSVQFTQGDVIVSGVIFSGRIVSSVTKTGGKTPSVNLPQGSYAISLSKDGYQPNSYTLEVKGSTQSQSYTLKLQPQDMLNFEAVVQKNGSGATDETVCLRSFGGDIACKKVEETSIGLVKFDPVSFKAKTDYWMQLSSDATKQSKKFTTGTLFDQLSLEEKVGIQLKIKWTSTPTGLKATAGDRKVDLRWDAIEGTEYHLHRDGKEISVNQLMVTLMRTSGDSYPDEGLTNGQQYCYQVTAKVEGSDESKLSTEVCATPQPQVVIPPPSEPATPELSIKAGIGEIRLDWNTIEGATYLLYKEITKLDDKDGVILTDKLSSTDNFYTDTTVDENHRFCYQVTADVNGAKSGASNKVCATPEKSAISANSRPVVSDLIIPSSAKMNEKFTVKVIYSDDDGNNDVKQVVFQVDKGKPGSFVIDNDTGTYTDDNWLFGSESGEELGEYDWGGVVGDHQIDVYVVDSMGNQSVTMTKNITITKE